jgi:hydroxyethylthiazole kinase-like uncharacterized protein yjeF
MDELLSILKKDCVVAVGPGLGMTDWSSSLLKVCVESSVPLVVDADGLNLLAQLEPLTRGNWILTPHPAEAARLLACTVKEIQQDRVSSAVAIARRFDACVVLKGCGTVIADASGGYAICPAGNPGMATAGSGDVLTGIIVALLAQGLSVINAARVGVLAHAMAGDHAAALLGEMALIASDITDALPEVWGSANL